MIKMKRYALLLAGLTLINLAGCGKQEPPLTITDNPSSVGTSADVTSAAEPNNEIPAGPSAPAESENPTDSIPETRLQAEETETPVKPSGTEYVAEPKQPAQTEEKTNSASSTPPPKESETQKTKPAPTQPPAEEPPQSEPPQETATPEELTVPDFNIQTWIDYAKTYAVSIGLRLESSAVDCWDNPITAGAHSLYLERDIESRLNRYSKDEDITDVWIWAEERSDGSYDLYIGYAYYDGELTMKIASAITLHADKAVSLTLKNGQQIRKEKNDATDSTHIAKESTHHCSDYTAGECAQHTKHYQTGSRLLPSVHQAGRTA